MRAVLGQCFGLAQPYMWRVIQVKHFSPQIYQISTSGHGDVVPNMSRHSPRFASLTLILFSTTEKQRF